MQLILIVAGAIGLVVGSLAAAALLCWFLWYVFQLALHPEWGALAILIFLVLGLVGELPRSQFLAMTLTFAVIAAAPLWFAGRAWRRQRGQALKRRCEQGVDLWPSEPIAPTQAVLVPQLYPAIAACINDERSPTREEVHVVASRLWREGFAQRFGSQTTPASFAARRMLLRAASAALSGTGVKSGTARSAVKR